MLSGLDSIIVKNVTDKPIFLNTSPAYPGFRVSIPVESGEQVRVKTNIEKVVHEHNDGIKYTIHFRELLDGTGWMHDFDPDYPSQRTLSVVSGICLGDIARAAEMYELREIAHNHEHRAVCFGCSAANFIIYYTTGTVIVCLPHPRFGQYRYFHFSQSMRDLCDLFADPRKGAITGAFNSNTGPNPSPLRRRKPMHIGLTSVVAPTDRSLPIEVEAVRRQIHQVDEEMRVLKQERGALESAVEMLSVLDQRDHGRRRQLQRAEGRNRDARRQAILSEAANARAIVEAQRLGQRRIDRGQLIRLHSAHGTFFQRRWTIEVCSFALGDFFALVVYDDGSWSACGVEYMPPLLQTELHLTCYDEETNPVSRNPLLQSCSIGSHSRCFLRYSNGTCIWHASDEFAECVHACEAPVREVAFGASWDSFFILFQDHSYSFNNIPRGLEQKVDLKIPLTIDTLSLGSADEWFLRQANGACNWGNISPRCQATIAHVKQKMISVHFGLNDKSFLIRYKAPTVRR